MWTSNQTPTPEFTQYRVNVYFSPLLCKLVFINLN